MLRHEARISIVLHKFHTMFAVVSGVLIQCGKIGIRKRATGALRTLAEQMQCGRAFPTATKEDSDEGDAEDSHTAHNTAHYGA